MPMTREEWCELMDYLAREKLYRARLRRRYPKHIVFGDQFHRLIEQMSDGYTRHARHPDKYVDLDVELDYMRSVQQALSESTEIAHDIGMLDVLEDYETLIREGMSFDDIPKEDVDVLRQLGESDPRGALLAAFHKEKSRSSLYGTAERFNDEPRTPGGALRRGEERIRKASEQIKEFVKKAKEQEESAPRTSDSEVRPTRRWFKGLGKVAQGSALTIADACLAAGILDLPVDPATQSWGSIVSSIAGVGMTIEGIGEFRGE